MTQHYKILIWWHCTDLSPTFQTFSATTSSPIDGFVYLSVCNAFFNMLLSGKLHETYTRHWSYKIFVAHKISSQKVKGQGNGPFETFAVSAPWLRVYLTDLFYTWHKYNPWHVDVSRFISRSKGERWGLHRSFEMKVTPVISSFCRVTFVALSLFSWMCNTPFSGRQVKGQVYAL